MKHEDQIETDTRASGAPEPAASAAAAPDLEELVRRHRELDEKLEELTKYGHLSPLQQHEAAVMKKRKLALKDRIAALAASS
ncbi:MAG: YdcH family protein [Acidobacteriota bacterium]|nr:YdcH family protein [Acidobacteriota bacterium]MDE3263000.1 YdcH family protein [Acidobacteriota bacterium]